MNALPARASDLGPVDDRDEMAWDRILDEITEDDDAISAVSTRLAEDHADLIAALTTPYANREGLDRALARLHDVAKPLWLAAARWKFRNREG